MSSSGENVPYGYALSQNSKDRMEDVIEIVDIDNKGKIFLVMDGHNGRGAVDFVSRNLPNKIIQSPQFMMGKYIEAMRGGFEGIETELKLFLCEKEGEIFLSSPLVSPQTPPDCVAREAINRDFPKLTSGVVVCVVLIIDSVIYTAHVGDCRAVIGHRGGSITQLTEDHNITNQVERERVKSLISTEGYVKGLMVTRSLGNYTRSLLGEDVLMQKVEGQISDPCFNESVIDDNDEILVIASDGLYEVMSNDVVIDTVMKGMRRPSFSPTKSAQELVDRAISRGSSDNVCVCLVMLDQFRRRRRGQSN